MILEFTRTLDALRYLSTKNNPRPSPQPGPPPQPDPRPTWSLDRELSVWPGHWLELWKERSSIREYDGGEDRVSAELSAYQAILDNPPAWSFPVSWSEEWIRTREDFRRRLQTDPRWKETYNNDNDLRIEVDDFLNTVPVDGNEWFQIGTGSMMVLWGRLSLDLSGQGEWVSF